METYVQTAPMTMKCSLLFVVVIVTLPTQHPVAMFRVASVISRYPYATAITTGKQFTVTPLTVCFIPVKLRVSGINILIAVTTAIVIPIQAAMTYVLIVYFCTIIYQFPAMTMTTFYVVFITAHITHVPFVKTECKIAYGTFYTTPVATLVARGGCTALLYQRAFPYQVHSV
jgi:hypothetical protein